MTRDGSDLDWLAFQYIAGEMNVEDAARFDARLAVDQAAREAVAGAVELSEIAAITECRQGEPVCPRSESHRNWSRSMAWLGWAAAGCLLVVAFVQQSGTSPWISQQLSQHTVTDGDSTTQSSDSISRVGSTAGRAPAAPDLALAWVHTRARVHAEDRLEEDRPGEDRTGEDRTENVEADENEERRLDEAGLSAPSWMVTAVAGLDADMSEGE